MKKIIQICIVVCVCLMAATSAGFMKIPQQADSVKAVEINAKQDPIPSNIALSDFNKAVFQRRPIEPGELFLFGIGIIGIIGIHRLKFQ